MKEKKYIYEENESWVFNKLCRKARFWHKSQYFTDEFYQQLNSSYIFDKKFGDYLKHSFTLGYCHYYALLLASVNKSATLKIGRLNKLNSIALADACFIPFDHSWVEVGDVVYDTTSKQMFDKDYYYKLFDAEVKQSFPNSELRKKDVFFERCVFAMKDRTELLPVLNFFCHDEYKKSPEFFDKVIDNAFEKGDSRI